MANGWIVRYADSAVNTGISASASEAITSSLANVQRWGPFNTLTVTNRDAVDIEIRLDGLNVGGKVFTVPAGVIMGIEPEEDIHFSGLVQVNLSSATAETAGKVLFRWARADKVL